MRILVTVMLMLIVVACGDDGNGPTDTFDRKAMLTDMADKVIMPAYADVLQSVEALKTQVSLFTESPDLSRLDSCRQQWQVMAERWQDAVTFDFGPADGLYGLLSVNVATFPVTTSKIETYIASGDTTQNNFDRDARGIYGAEYLLFNGTAETVVGAFSGDQGANRRAYLRSVIATLEQEIGSVDSAWRNGYRDEFISRAGTDAGSGTSLLFNHLNISFELLKNYKLALPLGKRAGQTASEPTKVEAYYSGISKKLMDLHYDAVMRIWYGKTRVGDKILGFKDYLATVSGGERLITDTEAQDQAIVRELNALGSTMILSDAITSTPASLDPLYVELFKLTRFIKSEMSSLLGISITYSSGDGD